MPLEQAVAIVRSNLPKYAILVGQNIGKDIEWLGLKEGEDFSQLMDLAGLYRIWNPKFKSFSVFGQDHLAKVLLGWETSDRHDAVGDALKSIRLFNYHRSMQNQPVAWENAQKFLLETEPEPSFARKNPSFEGVCMGNKKTCMCGAAFFF
jgi:RNA exonuclease 4